MPELPEVEALALDLKGRLEGRAFAAVHLAAFSALKTYDPPVSALVGTLVDDVTRHGKFLDIEASGLHVIFHLARAGWIRWKDEVPALPPRPNSKSGLAVRIVLDDEALLTPDLLRLTRWMADYYLCGWGQVLNAVVPAGAKEQAGTRAAAFLEAVPEAELPPPPPKLTPKQTAALEKLRAAAGPVEVKQLARLAGCGQGLLDLLVAAHGCRM